MKNKKILITGGTGYIGSHIAVELINAGYTAVLFDDLSNSKIDVVSKIEKITNKKTLFINGNLNNTELLTQLIKKESIEAVINLAGKKSVSESFQNPLLYYQENVSGLLSLLKSMKANKVYELIFSSSATVYGTPDYLPIDEQHSTKAINPYGRTKLHIEEILNDLTLSHDPWKIVCLRYFNPVGAHESGLIGELPVGIPNNIMPYIVKVAAKEVPHLNIFGNDYATKDGTGERDYIHVVDLARGHLSALMKNSHTEKGMRSYNLGTGIPYSVMDLINIFTKSTKQQIPYEIKERRLGDVPCSYADVAKAKSELGWESTKTLEEMCVSSWNFYKNENEN